MGVQVVSLNQQHKIISITITSEAWLMTPVSFRLNYIDNNVFSLYLKSDNDQSMPTTVFQAPGTRCCTLESVPNKNSFAVQQPS